MFELDGLKLQKYLRRCRQRFQRRIPGFEMNYKLPLCAHEPKSISIKDGQRAEPIQIRAPRPKGSRPRALRSRLLLRWTNILRKMASTSLKKSRKTMLSFCYGERPNRSVFSHSFQWSLESTFSTSKRIIRDHKQMSSYKNMGMTIACISWPIIDVRRLYNVSSNYLQHLRNHQK